MCFSMEGLSKVFTFACSDNTYIEVLDSTRVHPETYEWARKMAVDALEYDEVHVCMNCIMDMHILFGFFSA